MKQRQLPFWLLTAAVFIILIIPKLLQDGMFMDGQQYACVSKNLADGLGTFWFPYLSATWYKNGSEFFLEHPPLIYGIQSLFFKVLGDSIYVERIYSLLTAIVTALLIIKIWKQVFHKNSAYQKLAWLPVLLWISIPVCFWSYQNNMHENTLGVFTAVSLLLVLKALGNSSNRFVYFVLSSIAIFMASFSKGLPGFFPIISVFIYWLVFRSFSFLKMCLYTFILIAVPAFIYSLLMVLNDSAERSLTFYFFDRLLYRVTEDPSVNNQFIILGRLFMELLPPIIISLIILAIIRLTAVSNKILWKPAIFFLLIGLAGSLPLMFTPVQSGFYLVPSFPYYAIAFAIIPVSGFNLLLKRIMVNSKAFKIFRAATVLLLLGTVIYSSLQIGKAGRDEDMLHDVYIIGKIIPNASVINSEKSLHNSWPLQFYLMRHFNISLGWTQEPQTYYLIEKKSDTALLKDYKLIPLETLKYNLYKLRDT